MSTEVKTGKVKWFDEKKGYGFIKPEEGEDLFVHVSNLESLDQLDDGERVEFEVKNTEKGMAAESVRPDSDRETSPDEQDSPDRPTEEVEVDDFSEFGLESELITSIERANFESPRPVQAEAIPPLLEGRDMVGTAPTGTGKTAAFLLPYFQLFEPTENNRPTALVLAPTHELADQITEEAELLNPDNSFEIESVYGGTDIYNEIDRLKKPVDLLVACPGRLRDHIGRRTVDLGEIEYLVLDEADRMCDMGFLPEVKKIMYRLPGERQNLFFSATIPDPIQELAADLLDDPKKISVGRQAPSGTISHSVVEVKPGQKKRALKDILDYQDTESVLVFCRTRKTVRGLAEELRDQGYSACGLQGGMDSIAREATMSGFRRRNFDILVATNVAARGLDVQHISHVINFDVPREPDVYTHRIGRTGRSGETGDAYTLVTSRDKQDLREIEQTIGYKINREKL